jgi:hypothetical protein
MRELASNLRHRPCISGRHWHLAGFLPGRLSGVSNGPEPFTPLLMSVRTIYHTFLREVGIGLRFSEAENRFET